jgi:DHA1 family bicyclomycin/chloramphenicol resistance-like MFS transporter
MILPTSTTLALDMEKQNSGNASAIIGFLTFVSGGVISPLTGLGNIIYSTSIIIVLCCVLILFCTKKVIKPIVAVDK